MVCGVFVARLLMQANKIAVKVCRTFVRLPLILSFSVDTFFFNLDNFNWEITFFFC